MLAEAGWKDTEGDGILRKDGKPFEFTIIINQGNDVRKNAATIIQSDLKKVGIRVKIRVIEWAAFLKNFINKRNFERGHKTTCSGQRTWSGPWSRNMV
jgi:peptide/nickel transport system substrate-binding protein